MNKKYNVIIGLGVIAILYFAFRKKTTTTAKSTTADKSDSSTIKSAKVEGGTISIDEKEVLDAIKKKTAAQAGDSPKVVAIKKFFAEVSANPPKSEQDFMARASKAGLTKADLQSPEAQKIMNPFDTTSFDSGTAQRPTRPSKGRKSNSMGMMTRMTDTMDFDGFPDVQANIM